jgi:ATP-dependent Lon protease
LCSKVGLKHQNSKKIFPNLHPFFQAKRSGIATVILPEDNKKDFEELEDFIKKDIETLFVSHYEDVFDFIFPELAITKKENSVSA